MAFWKRGIAVGLSAISLGVGLLGATPAQAAEPTSENSGWINKYNDDGQLAARGYFDADANGKPGQERFRISDRLLNDRRAMIWVTYRGTNTGIQVRDPSADGEAVVYDDNVFAEGTKLDVRVCTYSAGGADPDCTKRYPAVA